jgi:M6 family metalloprotease-like protein
MNGKKLLSGLCVLAAGLYLGFNDNAWSAPAAPIVHDLVQPDGHAFQARQKGDEFANWYETIDGYAIVQDQGAWYYADKVSASRLASSGTLVSAVNSRNVGARPRFISLSPEGKLPDYSSLVRSSVSGKGVVNQNMMIILVDFLDIGFTYSDASYEAFAFGAAPSVKDFYSQNSYGDLNLTPVIETQGTANDGVIHVSLGYNHPSPGNGGGSSSIAGDALAAANPFINFAPYDTNGDGEIHSTEIAYIIVLAGYENSYNSQTPTVWGHASYGTLAPNLDGKTMVGYSMIGERHGGHQGTIGIICHEFGHHLLRLPDLYDTNGGSEGIGKWGLMAGGSWNSSGGFSGNSPSNLSAWSKSAVGFLTPQDIDSASPGETISNSDLTPDVKRLWIDKYRSPAGEYFLVENRQQTTYDVGLVSNGLMIWHIDGSRATNSDENNKWVDLEAADGNNDMDNEVNRGDIGDPYPGSTLNTTFNWASNPNSRDYDGNTTGVRVTNISASAATMTADFVGTAAEGDTVYYDDGTGGQSWGFGSPEAWSALVVTNSTTYDHLNGIEVYVTDASANVAVFVYEEMIGGVPTGLMTSQGGYVGTFGWNRFMLDNPPEFPISSSRVIVLRVTNASYTFPIRMNTNGAVSGRSYFNGNNSSPFLHLVAPTYPFDVAVHALIGDPGVSMAMPAQNKPWMVVFMILSVTLAGAFVIRKTRCTESL